MWASKALVCRHNETQRHTIRSRHLLLFSLPVICDTAHIRALLLPCRTTTSSTSLLFSFVFLYIPNSNSHFLVHVFLHHHVLFCYTRKKPRLPLSAIISCLFASITIIKAVLLHFHFHQPSCLSHTVILSSSFVFFVFFFCRFSLVLLISRSAFISFLLNATNRNIRDFLNSIKRVHNYA